MGSTILKFIYSEKATKFCEIFTLLLTTVHTVKRKVNISQNFVAFSEYMNFTNEFGAKFRKNVLENEHGDVKNGIFVKSKFLAHYFFRTGQTDI